MRFLLLSATLVFGACDSEPKDSEPDFSRYREAVKQRFPLASTVDFGGEKLRTLWSANGQRLTLYCSEVKTGNSFGDPTGLFYAQHVVSAKDLSVSSVYEPDQTFVDDHIHINHYLNCVRPDTQRPELGKPYFYFGDTFDPREADRIQPVMSNEPAPELR